MTRLGRTVLFVSFAITSSLRAQQDLSMESRAAGDALRAGRYTEAILLYRKLVATLPDNAGIRLNLGFALEKGGHPTEAANELSKVVRAQPDLAPAWFLLGLAFQQSGQPQKAIDPLRKAVLLDALNLQAQFELADAELSAGEPRRAAEDFTKVAAAHPEMAKAWQGLGVAYAALGERAATRIDQIAPQSGYWYALVARERTGTGKPDEGLKLYEQALAILPDLPGLHEARASIFRDRRQLAAAAEEEKLEGGYRKPECTTRPGACAYLAGDWMGALAAAEKAATPENLYWAALACGKLASLNFEHLAALPESAETHELLAESSQRLGRRSEAVEEWRKALRMNTGDHRLQGRLAESLARNREYEEAERILTPLAAAEPENADWQYQLGDVLFQERRHEAALPYLLAAERLTPDRLAALETLGRVYLALGQLSKAVSYLERARAQDDGGISFALSTAYRRLGREDEARAALARYRQLTQTK